MPLLFSYGTLQQEAVQLATFGRRLTASPDAILGFELGVYTVTDPEFVASSGKAEHAIVRQVDRADSRVDGTVLELTDAELAQADAYEPDGYERVLAPLESGGRVWVYAARE